MWLHASGLRRGVRMELSHTAWHFRSEVLLRSPSAKTPQGEPKTALKEKFVAVYQALFSNQDPSGGSCGARRFCGPF